MQSWQKQRQPTATEMAAARTILAAAGEAEPQRKKSEVRAEREARQANRPFRRKRHAEWQCNTCGKSNWLQSVWCRECKQSKHGSEQILPAEVHGMQGAGDAEPASLQQRATWPTPGPPGAAIGAPQGAGAGAVVPAGGSVGGASSWQTWGQPAHNQQLLQTYAGKPADTGAQQQQQQRGAEQQMAPAQKARALEKQAAELEFLGVGDGIVKELRQQAQLAWEQHRRSIPVGVRYDLARKVMLKAEDKANRAAVQVRKAMEFYDRQQQDLAQARAAMEAMDCELTPVLEEGPSKDTTCKVVRAAEATLGFLEQNAWPGDGTAEMATTLGQLRDALQAFKQEGIMEEECAQLVSSDDEMSANADDEAEQQRSPVQRDFPNATEEAAAAAYWAQTNRSPQQPGYPPPQHGGATQPGMTPPPGQPHPNTALTKEETEAASRIVKTERRERTRSPTDRRK